MWECVVVSKVFYRSGSVEKSMVGTTGTPKISIMLVLSISILSGVLVTGTVVNILAAGSINVQTKENQDAVTARSTGISHNLASGTESMAHRINVQTKTKVIPVTSKGNPHISSAAQGINQTSTKHVVSNTKRLRGDQIWNSWFNRNGMDLKKNGNTFTFGGQLIGETYFGTHGIRYAPIILGVLAKDRHFGWQFPWKISQEGWFGGSFHLCDGQQFLNKDHHFYFTAYFKGGPQVNVDEITGGDTVYNYKPTSSEGSSSWGPHSADICGPDEEMFKPP
jgi:hypothetical protein